MRVWVWLSVMTDSLLSRASRVHVRCATPEAVDAPVFVIAEER